MWEDPQCVPCGKWSVRFLPTTHTNKFWEDLALALIGDMFSDENEVLGILVNLKPNSDQMQIAKELLTKYFYVWDEIFDERFEAMI